MVLVVLSARRRLVRIRCYPLSLMRPWWRLSDCRRAFKRDRGTRDLLGIARDLRFSFASAVSATGQHNFLAVARAAAPSQWNATRPRRKAAGTRNGAPSNTARRRLARSSFRYRVVIALRYRRSARFPAAHWPTNRSLSPKPLIYQIFTDLRPIACDSNPIFIRDRSTEVAIFFLPFFPFFFFFFFLSIKLVEDLYISERR